MNQTMKPYFKPVVESIDIKAADCFMAITGSGEHGENAPAREQKEPSF